MQGDGHIVIDARNEISQLPRLLHREAGQEFVFAPPTMGEGGVHRVQRIPVTEANGRIHTSTATVAVVPVTIDVTNVPQASISGRRFSSRSLRW